ncbi:uncharacterized protein LOC130444461 [Diorhabda sublineata]|uniref:uncharacterized protein LOC130444461 n=1 Tax=Diorhabda sublineata TaxID=1163346 RepID=UPI0024E08C4C|nr:uncharacterized protein LOC130444461 [Diorhabda sublineata]
MYETICSAYGKAALWNIGGGGKDKKLGEVDLAILDILNEDNAVVDGINLPETQPMPNASTSRNTVSNETGTEILKAEIDYHEEKRKKTAENCVQNKKNEKESLLGGVKTRKRPPTYRRKPRNVEKLLCYSGQLEVYGEHALAERTSKKWFAQFKSGDFGLEDDERAGQPKKIEDEELEALLDEDCYQIQKELEESLGVTQAVSTPLKAAGYIQKRGNWVPHELKPSDVKMRL